MKAALILLVALTCAAPLWAETVVATRTIRAQEVIPSDAIRVDAARIAGAYDNINAVIGQEARVAIYPGKPILRGTIGAPALVERNQLVEMVFQRGGLRITSEGRALGRGGKGERIRVMNMGSRNVLFALIQADGSVSVSE